MAPTYPSPSAGLWAKKGSLGSVTNPLVGVETHEPICSELDPFSERSGRRQKPTVSLEDFCLRTRAVFQKLGELGFLSGFWAGFSAKSGEGGRFSPGARFADFQPSATA